MTLVRSSLKAPGPRGTMLLGCLGEFRRDPIRFLTQVTSQYGDIVRLRFGPIVAHVVNHPEYIGQVLEERYQSCDKRTHSVSKMRATCGNSLLTTEGAFWLRHRRLTQPAMQLHAVEQYIPVITAETALMLDQWLTAARAAQPIDIVAEMMRLTLAIAARVLFGSDIHDDTAVIEQSLAEILADTWRRVENIWDLTAVSPIFHRQPFVKAVRRIDQVVYRIIENRRRSGEAGEDLLGALLNARDSETGTGLTDVELRDATITMLLAGHETTANALASTLALIYRSPEVELKLTREVLAVLADSLPQRKHLDHLAFTEWTFAEAIRLYPSVWIMERRVAATNELGGYTVPAGSMLLISPYVLHRHPQFWEQEEQFNPERFSDDRAQERPKHAYIPFGAGPHQCIGRFMAPIVARCIVAMIVRRFSLRPVQPDFPKLFPGITLRHTNPLWMIPVERRDNRAQG